VFEGSLAERLGGSSVGPISISEESAPPRPVKVEMDFTAGKLGQLLQGRLLVLPPGALLSSNEYGFPAKGAAVPHLAPRAHPERARGDQAARSFRGRRDTGCR
jgi:hypothetical protein